MTTNQYEWAQARDRLVDAVAARGFSRELGALMAKELGSPRAIDRMTAYLWNEKPRTTEIVVDEMLAIRTEIDAWRERKAAREANARYNELLWYGLETGEESE